MDVYIGKIVNTHGIKGEVRILSDFKFKEETFKKGRTFYIGKDKTPLVMNTYRVHKNYDMVTFDGINDINDVLKYKGDLVYVKRSDLKIDGYVTEDLLGLTVYGKKEIGKVTDVIYSKAHPILVISKKYMVPMVDAFIEKIDLDEQTIHIKEIEGLIDEN